MPRGDAVDGVGIVRDPDPVAGPTRAEIVPPPSRRPAAARAGPRRAPPAPPARRPAAPRSAPPGRRRAPRRPRRGSRRARRGARPPRPPRRSRAPSASSVQTPRTGSPRLAPSPRAVAMPIRSPVKEPGPRPTAIRSTSSQPPAAAAAALDLLEQPGRVPGPPARRGPSSDSCRTSPSRQAQAAVSAVAVSKPTTTSGRPLALDPEDEGADFLAFDEPGDHVLAGDRRGHLVHVERPLFGFLRLGAEVFAARELDADACS